jgi:hypothetical protein
MDFDGPAPFVVGDQGATSSLFGDGAHHSNYDTPSSIQYDHTTTRCEHSFPALNSNNPAIGTNPPNIFSNKYSFALKTTLF